MEEQRINGNVICNCDSAEHLIGKCPDPLRKGENKRTSNSPYRSNDQRNKSPARGRQNRSPSNSNSLELRARGEMILKEINMGEETRDNLLVPKEEKILQINLLTEVEICL